MRTPIRPLLVGLAGLAVLVPLVGCSETVDEARTAASNLQERAGDEIDQARQDLEEGSQDARETAIRGTVSAAAGARLEADGYQVDGTLTCEATSPSFGTFTVDCSGVTVDGGPIEVTGGRPEGGGGEIVGTVAGEQVLTSDDCFGLC